MPQNRIQKGSVIKWSILAAVVLLLPVIMSGIGYSYGILLCCLIQIYIIAVSGLDIMFGYSGQISIGHAAFYALGAYGSGIMVNYLGFPPIISMLICSSVVALIAALLAYPASKLVFHFLALATIAFAEIVYQVIAHSPGEITGNMRGMFSSFIDIFGFELNTNTRFYYFGLVCLVVFLGCKTFIVDSKVGRAFLAIRENTHAAEGMGINVRKYKVIAFMFSAFFTAFAGGMYIHLVRYISPDTFVQKQSVMFITMLLFGGTASLAGPILGVITITILTEALRSLQDYQMLIYGVLMLCVIIAIPGGIQGALKGAWARLKAKNRREGRQGNVED